MIDIKGSQPLVSLRRADWRFLLPNPPSGGFQHLVLLGGPAGLAARLIEVGLARSVSCSVTTRSPANALVVLHDAPAAAFNEALGCLAPGGVLYYEVDRRRPDSLLKSPGRVKRALRARGLTPVGLYWAAPDFSRCRRYLPLDLPESIRWYLATLYIAATPWHRLLEVALRRGIGNHGQHFAALAPCFSLTAVVGPSDGAAPSALAHPALPLELQRPELRPLLITSGQDDGSRVVMLPFAPGQDSPIAVLKVARRADFNTNTEGEQATLVKLHSCLAPSLRRTIPQPLGTFRYDRLTVGMESYAAGRSLLVSCSGWPASQRLQSDDLCLAAAWLGDFHQQAQLCRLRWNGAAVTRWVELPLVAYAKAFGLTAAEEQLFTQIRQCARALMDAHLPIVWQHNDFGPWNIYRTDQALTVIDWEFSGGQQDRFGPALCDLLYFVTHWNYLVRRLDGAKAELQGFYELFFKWDRDETLMAVHRVMDQYMTRLDIDRRFLPLLLVYTWVQRALDYFHRQQTLGEIELLARTGNRYIQYISLLAEHRQRLFEVL